MAALESAAHTHELPRSADITVNLDDRQMGVGGDNSWGAQPHPEYTLPSQPYSYSYTIRPIQIAQTVSAPQPADSSLGVDPAEVFSWTVDPDHADLYKLYFGTDPGNLQQAAAFTYDQTTFDPYGAADMEWATRYYWRIDEEGRFADVTGSVWTLATHIPGDSEPDGDLDLTDLRVFSSDWLQSGTPSNLNDDDIVNLLDFAIIAEYWLVDITL
jgi:hypothetical protein